MKNKNALVKKRLIVFTLLSIATGWAIIFIIPLAGFAYGESVSVIILMAMMFSPAISNVLTRLLTKEGFENMLLHPHWKGNGKRYLVVFFGPSILLFLSAVIYFSIFPNSYDGQFVQVKAMLEAHGPAGMTAAGMLMISLVQIVVLGPIINLVPTLGEELGWRGYLLPKLRELFSDRAALIISGSIWGFWHLPALVMGHNYGKDYFGYPWLGIMAMIVFCVVLGIIEGYATIKFDSVIPAAMIHSALNAGAGLPLMVAKPGYNTLLGPAITGLAGGIPFIFLAIVLYLKTDNSRKI